MHEATLAKQILDVVLERVEAEGVRHIRAVHGWVTESEDLSAESLRLHFDAQAKGTAAEGAHLELKRRALVTRCNACGEENEPHIERCTACGSEDVELHGETGIGIHVIELEAG